MKFKILLLIILTYGPLLEAQVGIGTTLPDSSSVLDVSSNSQGLLVPRMTTLERTGILNPAEGLLVYDTQVDSFYYYDTTSTSWKQLSGATKRSNYVLVSSESDLPTASGGKITLDTNTLYEINGLISLSNPIELNGAYIIGEDSGEDILFSAGGTIFTGSTGGSIRTITLSAPGGTVFNINDTVGDQNFILQNTIIANSGNVGSLTGFNQVFMNVIQYSGNSSGITYTNVKDLLLNNQGWFGNNGGVYETITGNSDLIEKLGGFSQVVTATAGMDVTGITTISGNAVLQNVVFYGGGNYINGSSPYSGFNFSNDWTVDCPGIPEEGDKVATGYIYFASENLTSTDVITDNVPVKMVGTTTSGNFFRMDDDGGTNNRIKYVGVKPRNFTITCSATMERSSNGSKNVYSLIVYKNGAIVPSIVAEQTFENGVSKGTFNLVGSLSMSSDDYIEIYVSTDNKNIDPTVTRFNMVIQ
jgi:hypothetical protein